MNKTISIPPVQAINPAVDKKKYVRPAIEMLSVNASSSLLSSSQSPWADAKQHKPDFDVNLWDDELDDADKSADESTNWAGYQQNMSVW